MEEDEGEHGMTTDDKLEKARAAVQASEPDDALAADMNKRRAALDAARASHGLPSVAADRAARGADGYTDEERARYTAQAAAQAAERAAEAATLEARVIALCSLTGSARHDRTPHVVSAIDRADYPPAFFKKFNDASACFIGSIINVQKEEATSNSRMTSTRTTSSISSFILRNRSSAP